MECIYSLEKLLVEIFTLQGDGLRTQSLGEGVRQCNAVLILLKEVPQRFLTSSAMWGCAEKDSCPMNQQVHSQQTIELWSWTVRSEFLLSLSQPSMALYCSSPHRFDLTQCFKWVGVWLYVLLPDQGKRKENRKTKPSERVLFAHPCCCQSKGSPAVSLWE